MKKGSSKKKALKKGIDKDMLPIAVILIIFAAGIAFTALSEAGIDTGNALGRVFDKVWQPRISYNDETPENTLLTVSFIDVGQGDCILIEGERTVLIDTGEYESINDVKRYLKSRKVEHIDLAVVTHQHTDHMGGMSEIIESYDVDRIIMPRAPEGLIPSTRGYEKMLIAASEKGLRFTPAKVGYVYTVTDGDTEAKLSFLSPLPDEDSTDLNDYSAVCRLECGNVSWLFTGDLTENTEKKLAESGAELKSTVLKVAHHGSSGSSCREFLAKVKPSLSVISVGKDNEYGHPKEETLKRLERFGKVLRTDENGTIVMYTDGHTLTVKCSGTTEDKQQ